MDLFEARVLLNNRCTALLWAAKKVAAHNNVFYKIRLHSLSSI